MVAKEGFEFKLLYAKNNFDKNDIYMLKLFKNTKKGKVVLKISNIPHSKENISKGASRRETAQKHPKFLEYLSNLN